jgi:hypothetical protein
VSYVRGTLAALVDAVVPETPELAELGEEHVPGGLEAGLDELLHERVNQLQEADGGIWGALGYDTVPLGPLVAALLEFAALELVVRREREEGFRSPDSAFSVGPFSRLAPRDRLRAVRMLESEGVVPRLAEDNENLGIVQYLAGATVVLVQFCYYTELTGDGADGDGGSQGWTQAGYPGPADGYAVSMGYEVDEFEENDY